MNGLLTRWKLITGVVIVVFAFAIYYLNVFEAKSSNSRVTVPVVPIVTSENVVPMGNAILTLVNAAEGASVELSEENLLAMPQFTVRTENEFVDGLVEFVGPLARDVIALLGAGEVETLKLTAVNDYSVEIPMSDVLEYDVIFAMSQNGERLSIRDKGPIWVIYPMTDNDELQDRVYNDRLIWQLVKVDTL
jgi:hypothetical protein